MTYINKEGQGEISCILCKNNSPGDPIYNTSDSIEEQKKMMGICLKASIYFPNDAELCPYFKTICND